MTYEEEFDALEAFFDKYDELIEVAPRNSLLGMIRDLDDAWKNAYDIMDENYVNDNDERATKFNECIVHVSLLLAQQWADENQDIELHDVTEEGVNCEHR